MKNLNKKGQIGKIITSFPSMLLIFVIIILFIALSVFIRGIKNPGLPGFASGSSVAENSIMFNSIDYEGSKLLIYDSLIILPLKSEVDTKQKENIPPDKGGYSIYYNFQDRIKQIMDASASDSDSCVLFRRMTGDGTGVEEDFIFKKQTGKDAELLPTPYPRISENSLQRIDYTDVNKVAKYILFYEGTCSGIGM